MLRAIPIETQKRIKTMMINIEAITSISIRSAAEKLGLEEITLLGDNGKSGDARVTVYELDDVRVAATNGDPVWEESDPAGFAELLESEGINL